MIQTSLNWDVLGAKVLERKRKQDEFIKEERTRMEGVFSSYESITEFYQQMGIHVLLNTMISAAQTGVFVDWMKIVFMVKPEDRDEVLNEMLVHSRNVVMSVDDMRALFTRPEQLELFKKFSDCNYHPHRNPGGAFPMNDLIAFTDLPDCMFMYLIQRFDFSLVWRQIVSKPGVSNEVKTELFKRHAKHWLTASTMPAFDEVTTKLFPDIAADLHQIAAAWTAT